MDFEIIFTNAYSQYALKAFEVSAVDYLLKPIQISKLEASIEKLKKKLIVVTMQKRLELLKENLKEETIKKIALPVSDGHLFVNIDHIINFNADGAYTKVCIKSGECVLVSKNLKYFEDLLQHQRNFFRPHRSYIINLHFLKKYSQNNSLITLENDEKISIAKSQKHYFELLI